MGYKKSNYQNPVTAVKKMGVTVEGISISNENKEGRIAIYKGDGPLFVLGFSLIGSI